MKIRVNIAFHEAESVRLLNWLASANMRAFLRRPDLPNLYESGAVYRREKEETWCDVVNLLAQGHEDCDALAAYRAGELMARGVRAMRPWQPGYRDAMRLGLKHIKAWVFLRTNLKRGESGQYHCMVKYRIAGRTYIDDPSLRLGMVNKRIDPNISREWAERGIVPAWEPA